MSDVVKDEIAAAEYVLGVTDAAERAAFEAQMRAEPSLGMLVVEWELRFAGMNMAYAPMPAPDLFPLIESRLFGSVSHKTWRQRAALLLKMLSRPAVAVPIGIVVVIKLAIIWLLFMR